MLRERIAERAFPDWSMGFTDVSDVDLDDVEGFNNFLQVADDEISLHQRHVQIMLRVFKQNNRR